MPPVLLATGRGGWSTKAIFLACPVPFSVIYCFVTTKIFSKHNLFPFCRTHSLEPSVWLFPSYIQKLRCLFYCRNTGLCCFNHYNIQNINSCMFMYVQQPEFCLETSKCKICFASFHININNVSIAKYRHLE